MREEVAQDGDEVVVLLAEGRVRVARPLLVVSGDYSPAPSDLRVKGSKPYQDVAWTTSSMGT